MLKIRRALKKDGKKIRALLGELDLYYTNIPFKNFWVAETKNKIAGIVKLDDYKNFYFLSSLGVARNFQGLGIASRLLKHIIKKQKKDIYLYTIIPKFFKRFGFKAVKPTPNLPSKNELECERCEPKKCVCMIHEKGGNS